MLEWGEGHKDHFHCINIASTLFDTCTIIVIDLVVLSITLPASYVSTLAFIAHINLNFVKMVVLHVFEKQRKTSPKWEIFCTILFKLVLHHFRHIYVYVSKLVLLLPHPCASDQIVAKVIEWLSDAKKGHKHLEFNAVTSLTPKKFVT